MREYMDHEISHLYKCLKNCIGFIVKANSRSLNKGVSKASKVIKISQ